MSKRGVYKHGALTGFCLWAFTCIIALCVLSACSKKGEERKAGEEAAEKKTEQEVPPGDVEQEDVEEGGEETTGLDEQEVPDHDPAESDVADKAEQEPEIAPGAVQAQMIVIGWEGGMGETSRTPEQAETLAAKVAKEAKTGNFDKLVRKYSDGPKTNKGKTPPLTVEEAAPIFKPVFELKKGEVTEPIKGPNGFYIFKRVK